MYFGAVIKNIRESQGYSLLDIQKMTGINESQLYRIESGVRYPTDEQIDLLVDIFKLNKKDLLIQRDSDNILEEAVKDLKYPNVILDVAREKLETDGNYFPTNVYEFEKDERFLGTYNWFNADNFMMHTFADGNRYQNIIEGYKKYYSTETK